MEYKKINEDFYIRLDPGDEVLQSIKAICTAEQIYGGYFQGIGACSDVTISTYIPTTRSFKIHPFSGMLEMAALSGNITKDINGIPALHAHAVFSQLENEQLLTHAGHLQKAVISYTAEITLHPAKVTFEQRFDLVPEVGVWKFPY